MMSKKTTPSEENYIEWIYRLSEEGPVRPAQLAEKMGVKRPSATRMIAALAKKALVHHEPYGEVTLTEEGQALGKAIVRRDECLTELLVTILDMRPDAADPEVHRLEHVLSDEVLARLEVLVSFASSSEAWLRRLHHRIPTAGCKPQKEAGFSAGLSDIHRGLASEKERPQVADKGGEPQN